MIFIYISSNSIQHEFFIYLICRTVIKTPEVLIFLDISKMSFRLNGMCLAFQDPAFTLDIGMRSFFQFLPFFSASFSASYLYRQRALCSHPLQSAQPYTSKVCVYPILLFALCPEMPQFTSVMADIELFIFKDPCPHVVIFTDIF